MNWVGDKIKTSFRRNTIAENKPALTSSKVLTLHMKNMQKTVNVL